MGLLRDRAAEKFNELDQEIKAVAVRLQQVPVHDLSQRQIVRDQIDELLDRRLLLQQELTIRAQERLISAR